MTSAQRLTTRDDLLNQYAHSVINNNNKLSYRKQIARQLRTQYVDGIYSNGIHSNIKI